MSLPTLEGPAAPVQRLLTAPFVAVTATVLVFFMFVGVLVPTLPKYVEHELAGGELGIGLTVASFAVAAIAVRPLISMLVMRHGHVPVIVGGALLAGASGALYGFTDQLPVLLLLRGVTGIGEAAVFVAAATRISQLSPDHRQAEASSYFSVAVFSGIGFGPIIGDALLERSGYRTVFVCAAVFAVGAAALGAVTGRRRAMEATATDTAAATAAGEEPSTVELEAAAAGRGPFIHPAARIPGLALAIGVGAFTAFSAFLPDHAEVEGAGGSGRFFAVYSVVCLVVRVLGARLPERLGPRHSLTVAFGVSGTALLLLAVGPAPAALWVSAALIGVGTAFLYPSLMAITVAGTTAAQRPRAIASFTMFFEIGTAAGGLALGAFADSLGKRWGFAIGAALYVVGLWFVRNVVAPRRQREHPTTVGLGATC